MRRVPALRRVVSLRKVCSFFCPSIYNGASSTRSFLLSDARRNTRHRCQAAGACLIECYGPLLFFYLHQWGLMAQPAASDTSVLLTFDEMRRKRASVVDARQLVLYRVAMAVPVPVWRHAPTPRETAAAAFRFCDANNCPVSHFAPR
ncbi:unnamed protein product, partial [Iphiclides podalirius]